MKSCIKQINDKFLAVVLLSIVALTFLTCSDEGSEPENTSSLMQIKFDYYIPDAAGKGYVVITDSTGNILCKKELINNSNDIYYPTSSYSGTTINLYLIHTSDGFYHTSAYLNLKRGCVWGPYVGGLHGVKNPIKLKLKNIPNFEFLTAGTNYYANTFTNLLDTAGRVTMNYIENGKAYGQLVANGVGKYGFFDIDTEHEMATIDYSNLPETSLKQTITLPALTTGGTYDLVGEDQDGEFLSTYWLFQRNFGGNSFDAFYPGRPFQKYLSLMRYSSAAKHFSDSRIGPLNFVYEPISFDATLINSTPENFRASFTGEFDLYVAEFISSNHKTYIHVFASRYTPEFKIPDFSAEIPFEKLNFSDFQLTTFQMEELDGLTETPDYFNYYSTKPLIETTGQRTAGFRF